MNLASKIDGFRQMAIEEAEAEKNKVIARVDKDFEDACAEYRIRAEKRHKKKTADDAFALERLKNRKLQEANAKNNMEIVALRHKLLDDIAANVKNKLLAYVETDEYKDNLLQEINDVRWDRGASVVYLTARDLEYIRPRIFDKSLAFEELPDDCIGGYKMRFDENLLMDNTYKLRFEDAIENINIFQL